MAQAVVDDLEVVQVQQHDGRLVPASMFLQPQRLFEPMEDQGAIGQPGKGVVIRHMLQLGRPPRAVERQADALGDQPKERAIVVAECAQPAADHADAAGHVAAAPQRQHQPCVHRSLAVQVRFRRPIVNQRGRASCMDLGHKSVRHASSTRMVGHAVGQVQCRRVQGHETAQDRPRLAEVSAGTAEDTFDGQTGGQLSTQPVERQQVRGLAIACADVAQSQL